MISKILEIPKSWVVVKLGDFVENEKGKKPKNESKTETASHPFPYVDIQAFEENVIRTWTDGVGCRLCYETDFLMVWDGSRSGLVGKGVNGALGSTLVRINFPSMVNDYAFYFLQSKYQQINTRAKGVGIPHVDPALLWNYDFPIPSLKEQHRIVAKIEELFSELDKGVESLKTAQAQLKVYRQAMLKHAFEGKLTAQWRAENQDKLEKAEDLLKRIQQERAQRYQQQLADWETTGGSKPKAPKLLPPLTAEELAELPELPEGWGWFKLADLSNISGGLTKNQKRNALPIKRPFLRVGNVYANRLELGDMHDTGIFETEIERVTLVKGDLLVVEGNGSVDQIGRVAMWNGAIEGCVHQNHLIKARPLNLVRSEFILYFLMSELGRKFIVRAASSTSGLHTLSISKVESLFVPLCVREEQDILLSKLSSKLSLADQLDQTITASLQQAEALRQSILKKAFSGQLVAQDANDEPASSLLARIKVDIAARAAMAKPRKPQKTQAQPAPTRTNVIPFPVKLTNISTTDLHAGILARAYQHHEKTPKFLAYFGHVKAEKIAHLIEAHLGIDLGREPIKAAAGPNDYPHLKKIESRARKAHWFNVRQKKDGGGYVFTKGSGFDALLGKTAQALGAHAAAVDELMSLLLPLNTRQAEIVATLYAAWNNLLLLDCSPSDEEIVYEARENWHSSKLEIERVKFFKGLEWMRQKGLVPAGKGRYVDVKDKRKTTRRRPS